MSKGECSPIGKISGPFESWSHRHLFQDDGEGGTLLRDEVTYEPPGGMLGRLVSVKLLNEKMQELFDYRHEVLRRIIEAGDFRPQAAPEEPTRLSGDDADQPQNGCI